MVGKEPSLSFDSKVSSLILKICGEFRKLSFVLIIFTMKSKFLASATTVLLVVTTTRNSLGAEYTLVASYSGGPWSNTAAWVGGVIPPSDAVTDIILVSDSGNPFISAGNTLTDLNISFRNLTYNSATISTVLAPGPEDEGSYTLYGTIANPGGATQTISGQLKLSSGSHVINSYLGSSGVPQKIDLFGVVSGLDASAGIEKTGSGHLILRAANTYSGTTQVSAGVLQINHPYSVRYSTVNTGPSGSQSMAIKTVDSNGAFAIFGALEGADDLLVDSGPVDSQSGFRTLDAGSNNASTTYSGALSGDGNIIKSGTGRWNLTGINLYTGTTTVSAGNLAVNGSTASNSGAVTVASGARLSGSGTVGGSTTIQTGGTHAPGNSPGLESFSNSIVYSTGSIFEWELGSNVDSLSSNGGTLGVRGGDFDAVNVSGGVTIASGAIFKIVLGEAFDGTASFWSQREVWSVFNVTGTKTSVFDTFSAYNPLGGAASYSSYGSFSFGYNTDGLGATSGNLIWSPVPEPGNALVGLLIAAGWLRRNRKSSKVRCLPQPQLECS